MTLFKSFLFPLTVAMIGIHWFDLLNKAALKAQFVSSSIVSAL